MAAETTKMLGGDAAVKTLEIPADESQLSKVRDFIADICISANFSPREANNSKLAVDEACTNIIKHAYDSGPGSIKIRAVIKPGWVDISLLDQGKKFDFGSVEDPDLDQYVESGKKGGLGIFLINRLMDDVDYRTTSEGNELLLTKKSHTAVARALPRQIARRSSLKYKFTLRASMGLLLLIVLIGVFTIVRQTESIREQKTSQWMERRRVAGNLANKSRDLLLNPNSYSVEQTNLSSYLSKLQDSSDDVSYARVVDRTNKIISSSIINEIFSDYSEPQSVVLSKERNGIVWKRLTLAGRNIRDIEHPVQIRESDSNRLLILGTVHLGVYEDIVESGVKDPRVVTIGILLGVFLLGILLIILLVSIFVKPIQVLTDGVRAIGEGTMDGKISVDGPAEIGAIASVFNEITQKFKKAQDSILEQEKLQKEMEVAKQIQHSLLPRKMPDISGYDISTLYQAAAEVGGDYYDFVEVDDETIGVVVADVSGKGVPGSLVMTMIRTALRMEARGNKNASDVMARMNEFVTDDMKKGMFVTMFYVILDSKNRIISYASAGHNPMILYRYETNETYFLNPKGFPVGINLPDQALFRKSINVEKIKLKKDDMLIIYTDGVTEAMNETRDQYGEERLLEVIKKYGHQHPEDFIANLENDIKKFTSGNPQNDDITIVAVKEKLTADDVLFGIRKKLIDMVDVEGLSVHEACARMKVSPATYYRYKKRLELMGERGLKNKILRKDLELKRVSLEDRKEMLRIIREHPDMGAKRITKEMNKDREPSRMLKEKVIYDELKRLNLNNKGLRLDYLKRFKLISQDEEKKPDEKTTRKRIVEEFLEEVSRGDIPAVAESEETLTTNRGPLESLEHDLIDFKALEDAGVVMEKAEGGVTVLHVKGHLDSVSTSSFERNISQVIGSGAYKIVVDLSDVSYISSGGWGIFTGEVKKLREKGGDVVLVGMAAEVYDVFELLGFGEILMALHTVEEAVAYFSKSPEERLALKLSPPPASAGSDPSTEFIGGGIEDSITDESYASDWESLSIEAATVGDKGDAAVLSLKGIIDTVSAEILRNSLEKIISEGIFKIVVDMSQVEYISSGGWGAFTERLREVRRGGGDIKLFGMDPDVYYIFTMLGFNIVLSSFDILADAIEDFSSTSQSEPRREASHFHPEPPLDAGGMEDAPEIVQDDLTGDEVINVREPSPPHAQGKFISWHQAGDDVLIARLSGSIDATTVEQLDLEVSANIKSRPALLLFNLENIAYISSSGWGIFAKYYEKCSTYGGRTALCCMSQSLFEVYGCLEFHSFIKAFSSEREALADFESVRQRGGIEAGPRPERSKLSSEVESAVSPLADSGSEPDELEDEIKSIDDILGPDNAFTESTRGSVEHGAGESSAAETEDVILWPQTTKPASEDTPAESSTERMERSREPEGKSFREKPSKDEPLSPLADGVEVDVDSAKPDEKIGVDAKLRKIGWQGYGEKLRKKAGKLIRKRKPEDSEES